MVKFFERNGESSDDRESLTGLSATPSQTKPTIKGYMVVRHRSSDKPLNLNGYFDGSKNNSFFQDPEIYDYLDDAIRCYGPYCINVSRDGAYVLRLGYDKQTMLDLIQTGHFHLGIVDAISFIAVSMHREIHNGLIRKQCADPKCPTTQEVLTLSAKAYDQAIAESRLTVISNPNFQPELSADVTHEISAMHQANGQILAV